MLLYTNRQNFFNDICEIIRLFLPQATIELCEDNPGFSGADSLYVTLVDRDEHFVAEASLCFNGISYSYIHTAPYRDESALLEKRYGKRCIKVAAFRAMRKAFPETSLPWGSLTGIRPTRLLRELKLTEGEQNANRLMLNEFDVTEEKLRLADKIVTVQTEVLGSIRHDEVDVYIGIPFCKTRCLYCSFASQLRTQKTDMSAYLSALKRDILNGVKLVKANGLHVRALYLGGGTPTILTADELSDLIDFAITEYDVKPRTEFTVEAGRPDTITAEKLRVIKKYGATRISVNPQTMCDATLRAVGREHTSEDIRKCFMLAREIGFDSINMDLIAGLPGEDAHGMQCTIDEVIKLDPDCLTVHTLAIKRSSRLKEQLEHIALPAISEVERMTAIGSAGAEAMGMLPYYMYRQKYMAGNMENVGYSKADKVCIYNIDMMEDALSIIAHGAGAMTKRVFLGEQRIERVPNPKDIATYIEKLDRVHAERMELFEIR
ncbi:MAG: coproporphyrinogen dehydrogenase HemZ [Christensenellaceae bacterium]|nr:coproporphyrinogen dehydrogenase HemZ [Christensenellaceae bacterium]